VPLERSVSAGANVLAGDGTGLIAVGAVAMGCGGAWGSGAAMDAPWGAAASASMPLGARLQAKRPSGWPKVDLAVSPLAVSAT